MNVSFADRFCQQNTEGQMHNCRGLQASRCEFPKGVVNAQPTQPTLFGDRES